MRRFELDSLRGLAALSVLIFHALAINIELFAKGSEFAPVDGWLENLFLYSPLRFLWSGGEAVWLFFVLSGLVLTRATVHSSFTWASYFPSRIIRLYVPVIGAVVVTWLSITLLPHVINESNERFLGGAATTYSFSTVINDMLVIMGPSTTLGPLWSLQWEILFSLCLPIYVYCSRLALAPVLLINSSAMVVGFLISNQFMMYMPMFMFGALIAQHWEKLEILFSVRRGDSLKKHMIAGIGLGIGITLTMSYWVWGNEYRELQIPMISDFVAFAPVKILGIVLSLIILQTWEPLRDLMSVRPLVFLGRISFSLYLIHWPVVISTAFLVGPSVTSSIVGFVFSVVASWLYFHIVERRSHNAARRMAASIR